MLKIDILADNYNIFKRYWPDIASINLININYL